jgi:beta-glucosidase
MRSVNLLSIIVTALFAYSTAFGQSGDFTVSGRVLVNGQPLANATVTYMTTAKRLSWDFSRADGTFGPRVSSTQPPTQNAKLSVAARGPVSIEIFDVSGKKIASVFNDKIDKGTYELEPVSSKLSQSVYLLKITAGGRTSCQKLLTTGMKSGSAITYMFSSRASTSPTIVAKAVLAVIDSVRIGKTGYAPAFMPISTYNDNVGDVTITTVDIEGQVNTLFTQMSNRQRAGQLCMPPNSIANLATKVADSNCGSIFGGGGALNGLSATDCANQVDACQTAMMGTTLKIPIMAAYDFVHGASAVPGATMFPHNMGMGAIQDTLLIQKAFRVMALEVRGAGCNWGFGPCIAVIRDDRWGRAYEGFCETPERTQIMARHAVLGLQLTDLSCPMTYVACAKHFAGDGNTAGGGNPGTTEGTDPVARAINLPGYVSAVATGVGTIMPSFSSWCVGGQMHRNKPLLTDWLKSATGAPATTPFTGFVVGDWEASWPLPASMDAGVDVPMAPGCNIGIISTNDAANNNNFMRIYALGGTYPARLDDACKRVLRIKYRMNLFNAKNYMTDRRLTALVGCAEHRAVARACVRASMVLLKNANALPIPKTASVTIWGTGGDNIGIQCGGWTVTWQGQVAATIPGGGGTSIRTAAQAVCTGGVTYVASPTAVPASNYVIAVLSENPYAEKGGLSIALTGVTTDGGATVISSPTNAAVSTQIAAAHTAGKKVIGILIAGRPLDISGVIANCDAFVWASLPGSEGAGITDVLFGDYPFTGKLQVTWPANTAQEPINVGDGQTGLFPYGFGL